MTRFVIEALATRHDRTHFSCGSEPLDKYLRAQAGQDFKRRVAICYVACAGGTDRIVGYYTLSAGAVPLDDLPDDRAKRLPRYPLVPVARVGRLAIDTAHQGKRLGAVLLWDAGSRVLRSEMGVFALVVDAKDDTAAAFYRHHGFEPLPSRPQTLFLPTAIIEAAGR